jgi:DNA-binding CsgD family transcriptional regulator
VKELYGSTELTEKERRIIALVAEGLFNRDIGRLIGTTEHVAKNYMRVIYDKTGMGNRLELALWWVARNGKVTS